MNDELLLMLKRIKNNIELSLEEIKSVESILNDSIVINDSIFKLNNATSIETKLNNELYELNNKIIPEVRNSR